MSISPQIASGNAIWKGLFIDTGPHVRLINLHAFVVVGASTAVAVSVIRTITRPHIIRQFQPITNSNPGLDVACDILMSGDTLVDTGAEVRDQHLSGGRLQTGGWACSINALPWAINIKRSAWFTVYKLAARNLTLAAIPFDINLTLELI